MKRQTIALLCIAIFSVSCAKKDETAADGKYTDDQKASYYIGLSIAKNMKQEGFKVDADLLAQAIKEEMDGGKKLMPAEEMDSFMQEFMQKQHEKSRLQRAYRQMKIRKKVWSFLLKIKAILK